MPTVPGVLHIGDYQAQGGGTQPQLVGHIDTRLVISERGKAPLQGEPFTEISLLQDRNLRRIVPEDGSGESAADAQSFWPWYDANAGATAYEITGRSTTYVETTGTPFAGMNLAGRRVTIVGSNYLFLGSLPVYNNITVERIVTIVSNTDNRITFAAQPTQPTLGHHFFIGTGRFSDYSPVMGFATPGELAVATSFVPPLRSGSSYQTGGIGMGMDAGAIRAFRESVWSTPPYFHWWKRAATGGVVEGGYDTGGTARTDLTSEIVRVTAAAAERGNTISWQLAIIDCSLFDAAWVAADYNARAPLAFVLYKARLQGLITWLRSSALMNNAGAKIILVNHDPELWNVSAPDMVAFQRAIHREVAAEDAQGGGLIEMRGRRFAFNNAGTLEPYSYATAEYVWQGQEAARIYNLMNSAAAPTSSGGYPVYLLLGDSISVGEIAQPWIDSSNSTELAGPGPVGTERPDNQKIWNDLTKQLETYEPNSNSNTCGTQTTAFSGLELSIMAELGKLHPDGFALLKRASNGSGLASAAMAYTSGGASGGRWASSVVGEHWDALVATYSDLVQHVNDQLGKQVDLRGAFVSLGHNDNAVAGGGLLFASNLIPFCNSLWELATRTSGKDFPIIFRRPQSAAAGVNPVEMNTIRGSLDNANTQYAQIAVIDTDGLERDRSDNLHETPETAVEVGRRMVKALTRIAI